MYFENIEYLKTGTERQRSAYLLLHELQILENLRDYDPLLVGTIPINIDIESSDLDIICHWTDEDAFVATLNKLFDTYQNYKLVRYDVHQSVVAGFTAGDFDIEIFDQNIPTKQQNAYRHMIVEHEILLARGEAFRQQIVTLKRQGHKTEPAFGLLLGLNGDPYEELLNFSPQR